MTWQLQSMFVATAIDWPALMNHIPRLAHNIQLAYDAFMSCLGVQHHTRPWEAHMHYQHFGQNESTDIGNTQRLQKEGNATINKVLATTPGLAKIVEKACISRNFESPETDRHIAANRRGIDCADTGASKRVH